MATSESTTQPIICCIGEDVAGRPTQFVLERAFDAERMHWQALSVEVLVEKFPLISEATLAMGFRGLRFYDEMESVAGKLLAKQGSLESFVGNATTALNIGDCWQIWDNRGPAWLSLLNQGDQLLDAASIWLQGDGLQARSLLAALIAQADSNPWVWTDAPEELSSIEHPRVQSAIADRRILFAGAIPATDRLLELLDCSAIESAEENLTPQVRLAVVTSANSLPGVIAECLPQWSVRLWVPNRLKLPSSVAELVGHRYSEADLAVAGEAYDFFRWTNRLADLGLLRDAYDEYCDF